MREYHRQQIQNRIALSATEKIGLCQICRYLLVAAAMAALMITYPWVHSEIISFGYQIQEMKRENALLREQQRALMLEQAASKSPQRIDQYARLQLGLVPANSAQVIFIRDTEVLPDHRILAESVSSKPILTKEMSQ
ncbi:MAG: cell division protein FtsL [Acidobacteria bacterium]|nr:cell division protein FtsL [Acidobacteriota bacterium]